MYVHNICSKYTFKKIYSKNLLVEVKQIVITEVKESQFSDQVPTIIIWLAKTNPNGTKKRRTTNGPISPSFSSKEAQTLSQMDHISISGNVKAKF